MSHDAPPTAVERFLSLLIAKFGETILECVRGGRRALPGTGLIGAVPVPSARLLGVFVVAGRDGCQWQDVLAASHRGGERHGAVEYEGDRIAAVFLGGEEFTVAWLSRLAVGLAASPGLRASIEGFDGQPGSWFPPSEEVIAKLVAQYDHIRSTGQGRRVGLELCQELLPTLRRLPPYYPKHVSIDELASALTVGKLSSDWTTDQDATVGLYSGMDTRGHEPALPTVLGEHRAILLGDPGHGKSTLAAGAVVREVEADRIALLCRLPDLVDVLPLLARKSAAAQLEAVVDAALSRAQVNYVGEAPRHALVESLLYDSSTLLVLDGLDEVMEPSVRERAGWLISSLDRSLAARLIITSRVTGYQRPMNAPEFLVRRLDPDAVQRFVDLWFHANESDELRTRALAAIIAGAPTDIPLVAGFVCYVAENERVSLSLHGLYGQYLALFLRRSWKPSGEQLRLEEITSKLRTATELAWVMATNQTSTIARGLEPSELRDHAPLWIDHTNIRRLEEQSRLPQGVVALFEADGLLVPHGAPPPDPLGQEFRWLHRTLHEHLAGKALAELLVNDRGAGLTMLRHVILRPSWKVAVEHTAGFVGLNDTVCDVLDALWAMHRRGDSHLLAVLDAIVTFQVASGSRHRFDELFEWVCDNEDWHSAFLLDAGRALAIAPDSARKRDWMFRHGVANVIGEIYDRHPGLQDSFDEVLKEFQPVDWANRLGNRDVRAGVAAATELLREGGRSTLGLEKNLSLATDEELESALLALSNRNDAWVNWDLEMLKDAVGIERLHSWLVSEWGAFAAVLEIFWNLSHHDDALALDAAEQAAAVFADPLAKPWQLFLTGYLVRTSISPESLLDDSSIPAWARAGAALSYARVGWPDRKSLVDVDTAGRWIDEFPTDGSHAPTAEATLRYWVAIDNVLLHHIESRIRDVLVAMSLHAEAPRLWWADGARGIEERLAGFPLKAVEDAAFIPTPLSEAMGVGDTLARILSELPPSERATTTLRVLRRLLNAPGDVENVPVYYDDALTSDQLDPLFDLIDESVPTRASASLLSWLSTKVIAKDLGPRYWSRLIASAEHVRPARPFGPRAIAKEISVRESTGAASDIGSSR